MTWCHRATFACLGLAVLFSACTSRVGTSSNDSINGVYVGKSPVPEMLPLNELFRKTAGIRARIPGIKINTGSGHSMEPLYADGTILVLAPPGNQPLERGMTVVYRNRENRDVAHVLIGQEGDGWRAAGLNNPSADSDLVQDSNIVGIVIAAFIPPPNVVFKNQ